MSVHAVPWLLVRLWPLVSLLTDGMKSFVSVVAVDSSQRAVDLLQENIVLNGLEGERCEAICCNVDTFLGNENRSSALFDIVVCDPPKFADSKVSVKAAARKYVLALSSPCH